MKTRFSTPSVTHRASIRRRITGATLLEVLVTVLILAIGFLGMAALQARALKGSVSASQHTQAVYHAQYLLDVLRVDRNAAMSGAYDTSGAVCNPAVFGSGSLANNVRREWLNSLKAKLGHAGDNTTCGSVDCDANGNCSVTIQWDDSRAGGLSNQTISLTTRL